VQALHAREFPDKDGLRGLRWILLGHGTWQFERSRKV